VVAVGSLFVHFVDVLVLVLVPVGGPDRRRAPLRPRNHPVVGHLLRGELPQGAGRQEDAAPEKEWHVFNIQYDLKRFDTLTCIQLRKPP